MKVLILGASGQVGRSLLKTAPSGCTIDARTRAQLDITNRAQLQSVIDAARPSVVINAAADTAVDRAEEDRESANLVNASAVAMLAAMCAASKARLLHISTDYVFDGQSVEAYPPEAKTDPINAYGASKLAGETLIAATPDLDWIVVRTSWVYAPWGRNFMLTMLRLFRERGAASVVGDQIGAPTSSLTLARFLWNAAVAPKLRGILHYTDGGVASWYDFAVAIAEEAAALDLLSGPVTVKSITTLEYPTPAKRPRFSLLSSKSSLAAAGGEQLHWRVALREVMRELKGGAA